MKREKLFEWIGCKAGWSPGLMAPFWLQIIRCLLFPGYIFKWLVFSHGVYQIGGDVFKIGETEFASSMFRMCSEKTNENVCYRYRKLENGSIRIESISNCRKCDRERVEALQKENSDLRTKIDGMAFYDAMLGTPFVASAAEDRKFSARQNDDRKPE